MKSLILIPARMSATRLPGKPMADIEGEPMIVHVWRRAMESGIGDVVVACDTLEIAWVIERAGGKAIMTRPDHASGSDRIFDALNQIDARNSYDIIINLQGDMPTIDPDVIRAVLPPLAYPDVDIATLAAEIKTDEEKNDPAVVKVVLSGCQDSGFRIQEEKSQGNEILPNPESRILTPSYRALYFTRAAVPTGEGPLYHHIGIYAYRRKALEHFVSLPPSPLEKREKLEQLRALEAGMQMEVVVVDTVPLGVDTATHLEKARKMIAERTKENL